MSVLAEVDPEGVGLSAQRVRRLVDVLKAEVDRQRLPGAVVLIARNGKLALFESLGSLDPATGVPMTRDAIFRIYSMTKPVMWNMGTATNTTFSDDPLPHRPLAIALCMMLA